MSSRFHPAQGAHFARPTQRHSAKALIPFFMLLGLITVTLLSSFNASLNLSLPAIVSLCLTIALGLVIQSGSIGDSGSLTLDLRRPSSLYGLFYFVYYGFPAAMLCVGLGSIVPKQIEISALALLGFVCFASGGKSASYSLRRRKIESAGVAGEITTSQWLALITTVSICVVIVAIVVVRSVQSGTFFLHDHSTGFVASEERVLSIISPGLEMSVILLLGVAASIQNPRLSRYALWFLMSYSGVMMFLWVLSSQFRPAFTGLILLMVALKLAGKMNLKVQHLAAAALISILCFGIVRGVREMNYGYLGRSGNQLKDSLDMAQKSAVSNNPFSYLISPETARRASGTLRLLSDVIQARDRGYDFAYGTMFKDSLFSLVPRAIWKEKPVLEPFQIQMRRHFGLEINDDPASLLLYSYANAGWVGVAGVFFVLGYFLTKLAIFADNTNRIGPWIFYAFTWAAVSSIEQETLLLTLSYLRIAVCAYVAYKVFFWTFDLILGRVNPSTSQGFHRWGGQEHA
jgi:hypothetical protein